MELLLLHEVLGDAVTAAEAALLLSFEQPERPIIPDVRFCVTTLSDEDCRQQFRFDVAGFIRLTELFALPEFVITGSRDKAHATEAVCILLHRLSYPKRHYDMIHRFGRSTSALCRIFMHVDTRILSTAMKQCGRAHPCICRCRAPHRVAYEERFAFIDGTKNRICRPSSRPGRGENLQKQVYSGHKRTHCLNYQAVVAPDGLTLHFWGPIEGRRHDSTLLRESKFIEFMESEPPYSMGNGDPAYGIRKFLVSGFRKTAPTDAEQRFNKLMSSVREAVEWQFGSMKSLWAFIDFNKSLRLRLSPIGKYVLVSMLLTNCHCCYNGGNQISASFGLAPPSLDAYLAK
ncbi:DDE superfamily endonuclease [Phytophthora infestans]|uniref:DDE superfamily endonuclease n=1 Tax=Phytophthora infestans TaxID=4787 RepID=A0A8S9TY78_PHYIN|nr:DDE superfamily endonuclease [Phytophthora infestans]KAF4133420.1 DDE superfamily endonuclease [Phytophthora infestans]